MAAIFFKREPHWKTKCHLKTGQRAIIGILNASGIPPAPLYHSFSQLSPTTDYIQLILYNSFFIIFRSAWASLLSSRTNSAERLKRIRMWNLFQLPVNFTESTVRKTFLGYQLYLAIPITKCKLTIEE